MVLAASSAAALLVALSWTLSLALVLSSSSSSSSQLPPPRLFAWLPFPSLLGALAVRKFSASRAEAETGVAEMKAARYRLKGA